MSSDEANIDVKSKTDELIQEPKKTQAVAGERIWGPYYVHKGTSSSAKYAGGPWGLGEPEDETLRVVERDVLIPNMLREKATKTWCKEKSDAFFDCAVEHGMLRMTWKCRPLANALRDCVANSLKDEDRINETTREYLDMRAEYRRTGIRKKLVKKP